MIIEALDSVVHEILQSPKKEKFHQELMYLNVLRNILQNMKKNDINRYDNSYSVNAAFYKIKK
jgi:hypothetical protein